MERVISENASDDSCDQQQKDADCEKRKVKTKKMKRRKKRADLHRRMLKAKKVLRKNGILHETWQSNFVKLLHRFADKREEYDKKANGKSSKPGKTLASSKICNRLLPKPLIGIYGNGAVGKEIRRSQTKLTKNDLNKARMQGDLFKLLSDCETESKNIVPEKMDNEFPKSPLFYPSSTETSSPILDTFRGGKQYAENNCATETTASTSSNSRISDWILRKRYEELTARCSRNFEKDLPDEFGSDPVSKVKQKLRDAYAATSRNQLLCEANRHDVSSSKTEFPLFFATDDDNNTETDCQPSHQEKNGIFTPIILDNIESVCCISKDNEFPDKRKVSTSDAIQKFEIRNDPANNASKSQLLFNLSHACGTSSDISVISAERKNFHHLRQTKTQNPVFENSNSTEMNKHNYLTFETSHNSDQATFKKMNVAAKHSTDFLSKHSGHEKNGDVNNSIVTRSPCFSEISKVDLIKPGRHTKKQCLKPVPFFKHTANNTIKFKVKDQNKFKKNLKHIPAILKRCTDKVNIKDINLVDVFENCKEESRNLRNATTKQNTVTAECRFQPELVELETESKVSKNLHSHFWTTKSEPTFSNQTNNEIQNEKFDVFSGVYVRNKSVNESTYTGKAMQYPPIQKTIVFTKKDACNIKHCLQVKDLHAEKPIQDSNIREIREKCHVQHERSLKNTYTNDSHNFHQISEGCNRSHRYSQNSDNMCISSQELDQTKLCHGTSSNPMICKKFLLKRKMQRHVANGDRQILHHDRESCTCFATDRHRDITDVHRLQDCSSSNESTEVRNSRIASQESYPLCGEDSCDNSILNGLQNLKVLAVDKSAAEPNVKINNIHCVGSKVILREIHQPVKYLAFENGLEIQRLPIYASSNERVDSVKDVELIDSKTNCCTSQTHPHDAVQKIVFVPKCEWNKALCVKPRNLDCSSVQFEGCSHSRQNKTGKSCYTDEPRMFVCNLENANNVEESRGRVVNVDDIQCQGIHEHSTNNACAKTQVFYYEK